MESLEGFVFALYGGVGVGAVAQFIGEAVEVDAYEEVVDGFGTHLGDELVGVGVFELLVFLGHLFEEFEVLVFGEEVVDGNLVGQNTGLDDYVALIIYNGVELLGGDAKEVANLVGERTEIPDVGYGNDELDVASALTTHFLLGDLHAATVAHDALVADALVLAAVALVVLGRTEDALAEEAVALGLVGTVIDDLWFQHFAVRVVLYLLGRCQANRDFGEVAFCLVISFECHFL